VFTAISATKQAGKEKKKKKKSHEPNRNLLRPPPPLAIVQPGDTAVAVAMQLARVQSHVLPWLLAHIQSIPPQVCAHSPNFNFQNIIDPNDRTRDTFKPL
jgi:hypothetical protein